MGGVAPASGGVRRGGGLRRGELLEILFIGGAFPYLDGVVRGAGCEFLAVRTEEDAREVVVVGFEDAAGEEGGGVFVLKHPPDVHVPFVIARGEEGAVACDGHRGDGHVLCWNKLMGAFRFAEVPHTDVTAAVGGDEFALVGVDDDVVDGVGVRVVALNAARARVPDFDGHVLGGSDHPFAFAVEGDAGDVVGVAFEGDNWVWVRRFDVVEFDVVAASCGEVFLVGGDAQAVDL